MGNCHCSWWPTRASWSDTIMKDGTSLCHMRQRNQYGTELDVSFLPISHYNAKKCYASFFRRIFINSLIMCKNTDWSGKVSLLVQQWHIPVKGITNCFLLEFGAPSPQEGICVWYCKSGESWRCHCGETTAIFLLSGHDILIKLPSKLLFMH